MPAVPIRAALVAAGLLGEPLAQRLHQLVEAPKRLDEPLFLLGQVFLGELPQPFLGDGGFDKALRLRGRLEPGKGALEDPVEAVEVALVLDERRARQEIEGFNVEGGDPLLHSLDQRQELPERHRDLLGLQFEEEGDEHHSPVPIFSSS
ncbi:hypothetical protein AB7M37_003879 [Sinorhizobium fredii]